MLDSKPVNPPPAGAFTLFKFANVDRRLLFEFDGQELFWDLGREPVRLQNPPPPEAKLCGAGELTLSHIALYRDIHYTHEQGNRIARAGEKNPFRLNDDEFFVLGDNSPNSEDARWWDDPPKASRGWDAPRQGVVPRYYLVGRALFVYWPSGFEFPWPQSVKEFLLNGARRNGTVRMLHSLVALRWIPNVGQMRFIYGGSGRTPEPAPPQAAYQSQPPSPPEPTPAVAADPR
jgi:hypothetical protein